MTTTTTSDLFVKTYSDQKYRFPVMVRHNGVVLAFAMDDARRIHYTVLDFGPGGSMSMQDADHWSPNPRPLQFRDRDRSVGFGVADQYRCRRPHRAAPRPFRRPAGPPGRDRPVPVDHRAFLRRRPVPGALRRPLRLPVPAGDQDPTAAAVLNAAQLTLLMPTATPASKE